MNHGFKKFRSKSALVMRLLLICSNTNRLSLSVKCRTLIVIYYQRSKSLDIWEIANAAIIGYLFRIIKAAHMLRLGNSGLSKLFRASSFIAANRFYIKFTIIIFFKIDAIVPSILLFPRNKLFNFVIPIKLGSKIYIVNESFRDGKK